MRSAAAVLIAIAGEALAHTGHGAAQGHFHWLGAEHVVLFAAVILLLAYALRK